MQYFYTRQRRALGLGHAVLTARTFVGDNPFVVALGDSIIGLETQSDIVARMSRAFETLGAAAIIAVEEVAPGDAHHYGIVEPMDGSEGVFELRDLVEKPARGEARSNLAIAARYVLSPAIFDGARRHARRARAEKFNSPMRFEPSNSRAAGSTASS